MQSKQQDSKNYIFTIEYYFKNAETTVCKVIASTSDEAIEKVNTLMGSEPYSNRIKSVEEQL